MLWKNLLAPLLVCLEYWGSRFLKNDGTWLPSNYKSAGYPKNGDRSILLHAGTQCHIPKTKILIVTTGNWTATVNSAFTSARSCFMQCLICTWDVIRPTQNPFNHTSSSLSPHQSVMNTDPKITHLKDDLLVMVTTNYCTLSIKGKGKGKVNLEQTRIGVGDQRHAPTTLPPRKRPQYPLYRRLGGPLGQSGWMRKISHTPGFNPGPSCP